MIKTRSVYAFIVLVAVVGAATVLGVTVLLMVGGMYIIFTGMEVYGQEQLKQQQQPTSHLSTDQATTEGWITSFDLENCDFVSSEENSYFILKPGYQLILGGQEDGEELQLVMTVLNETKVVDGIETRVVEEKETEGGNIVEVSRNYFAICKPTKNAIYFGEEVDMYKDGKIVSHEGAWLSGQNGSKAGMIMPGKAEVGLKYYQEIAPGVAEDRAEIISINDTLDTPAGTFKQVLKTEETNPLKPGEKEFKFYAPGIGLIQDEGIKLLNHTKP
jgi:hypothetical protein